VKISTAEKLERLISIVSWVNAHDGPRIDEVCERFGIDRVELVAQLDMASMIGDETGDYGDMPIEVFYEDDRVFVHLTAFERPLRLSPEQGLALLAAGAGLQQGSGGTDPDGPLARGLAKLAGVVGIDPGESLDVDLGEADRELLDALREAVADRRPCELDYWSAGRDHRTHRVVDPWRVFNEAGAWYLQGWCHLAEGERVFRVDRVRGLAPVEGSFTPPRRLPPPVAYRAGADDPRIVLELGAEARWVAATYPVDRVDDLGDGRIRVTMPAGAPAFLARLLLQLGPAATIVEADDRSDGAAIVAEAATRILQRYRS